MGRLVKNLGLYLIMIVLVVSIVNVFLSPTQGPQQVQEIGYSTFLSEVASGKISSVLVRENSIAGKHSDGKEFV
ncbi:MAG: ATP-dependent metallopeptidase FtsH/Yme1/Tma family protein, partial [Aminobacteriaceae bacterium]